MRGQWLSTVSRDPLCLGTLDLDEYADHFEGHLTLFYGDDKPVGIAHIITANKDLKQTISGVRLAWHLVDNPVAMPHDQVLQLAPEWQQVAAVADVELSSESGNVVAKFTADTGMQGHISSEPSRAREPSVLVPFEEVRDWDDFKVFAVEPLFPEVVYRGQSDANWKLRTKFHRSGRSDLIRYANIDVPEIHGELSYHTKHFYDLRNDIEYAAFLHLLQHHGFPTPLLDWSRSPFVAAYFAFEAARANPPEDGRVRIHMFEGAKWQRAHRRPRSFMYCGPHLTTVAPVALENARTAPQQAVSTVTNVDDVEWFVRGEEERIGTRFLYAVDLPYADRGKAMRELALMGITAASLYPGIEGVCHAQRIRLFGLDT